MASTYCEITKAEMAAILEPKGLEVVQVVGCNELVWERRFKSDSNLSLRIYSSITGNVGRGCGEDAIRAVVFDHTSNKPVAGVVRTHRVPGWQVRLVTKLHELGQTFRAKKCPACGSYMAERKGVNGNFLGCNGFPRCRHTERI
jgi:hypothetical protein